jgi:hypothetical protein
MVEEVALRIFRDDRVFEFSHEPTVKRHDGQVGSLGSAFYAGSAVALPRTRRVCLKLCVG